MLSPLNNLPYKDLLQLLELYRIQEFKHLITAPRYTNCFIKLILKFKCLNSH